MNSSGDTGLESAIQIWVSGGWLMLPLLLVTLFIYGSALNLFFNVHFHYLLRGKVHAMDGNAIARSKNPDVVLARKLIRYESLTAEDVQRHFTAVRAEYLPFIDRRIKFLGLVIATGPLIGLLGTVSGMLSTFDGMIVADGNRFDGIVNGISEALITTQTGLIISIPAIVILSLIIHRRRTLELAITRLERFNTRLALRSDCPIPKQHPAL
ncbi:MULTISPECIES: MotA/TolQ/ExbB proton channel family protein [unclassified Lentimonas]|uniref:MotA/TolQ/ExbB proton channel family protein n=1 Tax=unclassified Lentimonas TaxID=2630993 RepID=UPI001326FE1A|nr:MULTISPECIES: MotA/TolQ/ExbB proton channel family protein [unclassified Lentimonas]CAA6677227.1 Unannotated [Lentimonas sp. CC4]CAA6686148.1 Unannotated [Lentimonas sp. CC6]CAA6695441.1 Unannotated [Lentimonas sp. CC10]CAA6696614.1 Unannotated [Lentimonas sp. CC19]CAA7071306.1 Unannotated [Lentimonas sp. CC11]